MHFPDARQGKGAIGDTGMVIAFAGHQKFQRKGDVIFIFDHKDAGFRVAHATHARERVEMRGPNVHDLGTAFSAKEPAMPTVADLISAALIDPFRIILLVGLVVTQRRTAAVTGAILPLAAGMLFVAVIIPMTMGFGAEAGLLKAVVAGLVANAIWLVPIIAITRFWESRAGR